MSEIETITDTAEAVALVYANHGRWVADCPQPWCTNAMQVWVGDEIYRCQGPDSCGIEIPLRWPADPAAIEVILSARPLRRTRNWLPGEKLEQLVMENAAHGLVPDEWMAKAEIEADGALTVLDAVDEQVVAGALLPAVEMRREEIRHEIRMRQAIGLATKSSTEEAGDGLDDAFDWSGERGADGGAVERIGP